jgi:hypothetical protein
MQTMNERPDRRPKLYLPRFLETGAMPATSRERPSFPLSRPALRRALAEMMD